jgi:hypothetical protein
MARTSSTKLSPQIPWLDANEELVRLLLSLVISSGIHLLNKVPAEKWENLTNTFFSNDKLATLQHLRPEGTRRLKDKYKAVVSEVTIYIEQGGNTSAQLSDSRPLVYKLVKQIIDERADNEEAKLAEVAAKRKLDLNAEAIFGQMTIDPTKSDKDKKPLKGWGARKGLDGEIDDPNERKQKKNSTITPENSFEATLSNYLLQSIEGNKTKKAKTEDSKERVALADMRKYIAGRKLQLYDLFDSTKLF